MSIQSKLAAIQCKLRSPKSHKNEFGGYHFRSAEDIFAAVKPLLIEQGCAITCTDTIRQVGDRYYIGTQCELSDGSESVVVRAYAREPASRKGFDESQITGASSSYARKYALQGLFALSDADDDPDAQDNTEPDNRSLNNAQVNLLTGQLEKAGVDEVRVTDEYGVPDLGSLNVSQYDVVMRRLAATIKKKEAK